MSSLEVPVEILISLIPTAITVVALIYSLAKFTVMINEMRMSIKVLNHNTSAIVKALLASGVLKPCDIQEVDLYP